MKCCEAIQHCLTYLCESCYIPCKTVGAAPAMSVSISNPSTVTLTMLTAQKADQAARRIEQEFRYPFPQQITLKKVTGPSYPTLELVRNEICMPAPERFEHISYPGTPYYHIEKMRSALRHYALVGFAENSEIYSEYHLSADQVRDAFENVLRVDSKWNESINLIRKDIQEHTEGSGVHQDFIDFIDQDLSSLVKEALTMDFIPKRESL